MNISVLVAAGFLACAARGATLDEALAGEGLRSKKPNAFTVTKDQRTTGGSKSQHIIEMTGAAGERLVVKITKPVGEEFARSMMEMEQKAVKKLYAAAATPYMGDIAQAIGGCPAQFGPMQANVAVGAIKTEAVVGGADSKMTFGACDASTAKYKGALLTYYEKTTQAVWSWRIFVPWKDPKTKLGSQWLKDVLGNFE